MKTAALKQKPIVTNLAGGLERVEVMVELLKE